MPKRCLSCGAQFSDETAFCGNDASILIAVPEGDEVDHRVGSVVGSAWRVVRVVADGAMGRVYEARHDVTREKVAIKVLHAHVQPDRVSVERFRREAETAVTLSHPHVVEVKEFAQQADGTEFMVMEFLEGEELSVLLRRTPQLPFPKVVRLAAQTALALEHAHGAGVFHRDLKPDNLFVVHGPAGDAVKILDFGSVKREEETGAKLTAWGTTLGSPFYMSPEQAMGTQLDRRSDVWALGAIVFEMLTGKIAFDAPNPAKVLVRIMSESPPWVSTLRTDAPPAVDDVVERALVRERDQRTGSARELVEQLGAALGLPWTLEQLGQATEEELAVALAGGGVPARLAPLGAAPKPGAAVRAAGAGRAAGAPDASRTAETWVPVQRAASQRGGSAFALWLAVGVLGVLLFAAVGVAAWIWFG